MSSRIHEFSFLIIRIERQSVKVPSNSAEEQVGERSEEWQEVITRQTITQSPSERPLSRFVEPTMCSDR